MGVLFDYFRAPSHDSALSMFSDRAGLSRHGSYDVIDCNGIDPYAAVGKLVGLLLGVPYEEMVFAGIPVHRVPEPVYLADEEDGSRVLVKLSILARDRLAAADRSSLVEAAPLWAGIEEFGHRNLPSADEVLPWAEDLSGLARRARSAEEMLYCAICV